MFADSTTVSCLDSLIDCFNVKKSVVLLLHQCRQCCLFDLVPYWRRVITFTHFIMYRMPSTFSSPSLEDVGNK